MINVYLINLPMDGLARRVEWIGDFRRHSMVTRGMEFDVAFRRVIREGDQYVPSEDIIVRTVGAEEICGLPIGSVWRNGSLVSASCFNEYEGKVEFPVHDLQRPCIFSLKSRPKRGRTEDYASFTEFGSLLIPKSLAARSFYQGYFNLYRPNLKKVRIPIFVPVSEIARAWYLRDSELTRRLLDEPIDVAIGKLIDMSASRCVDGNCYVKLREGMSRSSVPIAAMLAFDGYARQAAKRMITTYVSAYARGTTLSIEALPPVKGKHVCRFRGELIRDPGGLSMFAYSLTAVPIPTFKSIEWSRQSISFDNVGGDRNPAGNDGSLSEQVLPRRPAEVHVHHGDSSFGGSIRSAVGLQSQLLDLPLIRRSPEDRNPVRIPVADVPIQTLESADQMPINAVTGTGKDDQDGRPRFRFEVAEDLEERKSHLLPAGFASFHKVVRELRKKPILAVRPCSGRSVIESRRQQKITLFETKHAWAFVRQQPRQAVIVEIGVDKYRFYFIEVKRRSKSEEIAAALIWRKNFQICRAGDIDRILTALAEGKGRWSRIHEPYVVRAIAHKFVNPQTFAKWIERKIRSISARALAEIGNRELPP